MIPDYLNPNGMLLDILMSLYREFRPWSISFDLALSFYATPVRFLTVGITVASYLKTNHLLKTHYYITFNQGGNLISIRTRFLI